jgi:hypothetical protein
MVSTGIDGFRITSKMSPGCSVTSCRDGHQGSMEFIKGSILLNYLISLKVHSMILAFGPATGRVRRIKSASSSLVSRLT